MQEDNPRGRGVRASERENEIMERRSGSGEGQVFSARNLPGATGRRHLCFRFDARRATPMHCVRGEVSVIDWFFAVLGDIVAGVGIVFVRDVG